MVKKILIAEDEKPMARALQLKLKSEGYDAVIAPNGSKALDFLKKEKFDLMLLDLMMPTVDGFEVLEELKKKKIKIPVLVSTNLGQEEDQKRAKDLGAKEYFVKADTPINEVVAKVKSALGK